MEIVLTKVVGTLLLPPALNLLLAALGLGLWRWRRSLALGLLVLAWLSLLAFSLPTVSGALRRAVEAYPALAPSALPPADAIVVLGGGRYPRAAEYGGDTVSERAMSRARYAATIQRRTGLPVLVSGGSVYGEGPPEALLLKAVLEEELRVPVAWVESGSRTTQENAALSAPILRAAGVQRFYLVTEASHMARAVRAFQGQGLEPVPAPTRFATPGGAPVVFDWLPSANALFGSAEALYASLGEAWYRLRHP